MLRRRSKVAKNWLSAARTRATVNLAACVLMAGMAHGCSPSSANDESKTEAPPPVEQAAPDEPSASTNGPRPKNLILISLDTVRADHIGCYGYERPTTPRLDAFAERGVVFLNCTSPSAWTVPSHMSILTSVEPATHGCVYYKDTGRINEAFETMQKIFGRHGFRTGAFTGGGFMSERYGMFLGFDTFSSKGKHFIHNLPDVWKWIEAGRDQPMFLFLHGFDAHKAYLPPPPYRSRFRGKHQSKYPIARFCKPGAPKPGPADLEYIVAQYDGEIAWVDDTIADFLDELDRRGILEDSLVIITTDHGDEFYEHGGCDHIHSLYDELIRAAWIMVGPSVPALTVRDHVGTLDILPTVLDIFGIEADAQFQGVSRVSAFDGHSEPRDAKIYSFTGNINAPHHLCSVRTNRWKLITDLPAGRKNKGCDLCVNGEHTRIDMKLFDLRNDPAEQYDLAGQYPEFAFELLGLIQDRIAESRTLALETAEPPPETPEEIERLRSLGYIE
jgi:arylsulfatase A-like enzyme